MGRITNRYSNTIYLTVIRVIEYLNGVSIFISFFGVKVFKGRLHSRRTAADDNERVSGHR